mmetsp:Transcript_19809/g.54627  ORF Transcript_19809/g.54627 Transcript_19809/m.54627 type:complete len:418 (+) Transcript_19809:76-1329(+)
MWRARAATTLAATRRRGLAGVIARGRGASESLACGEVGAILQCLRRAEAVQPPWWAVGTKPLQPPSHCAAAPAAPTCLAAHSAVARQIPGSAPRRSAGLRALTCEAMPPRRSLPLASPAPLCRPSPPRPLQRRAYAAATRRGAAPDPYEVLGVERDASADDIKRAYRRLALKWHPDRNPGNQKEAEAEFKKVSKAYALLSDADQRALFDRFGTDAEGFGGGAATASRSGKPMTEDDAAAIFRAVFGNKPIHEIIREVEQALDQQNMDMAAREQQLLDTSQRLYQEVTTLTSRAAQEQHRHRRDQLYRVAMERKSQAEQAAQALAALRVQHFEQRIQAKLAVSQLRMHDPEQRALMQAQNRIRLGLAWGSALGAYFVFGASFLQSLVVFICASLGARAAFAFLRRAAAAQQAGTPGPR